MDHSLEISWWPTNSAEITDLPSTSRAFLRNVANKDAICVQVESNLIFLPTKWRPILMVIDICQLHALSGAGKEGKLYSRLVVWYDRLRFFTLQEANRETTKTPDWMPMAMHRFLVRLELGYGHSPKALNKGGEELKASYSKRAPWSYGEDSFF
jgi:hypothetical protein